MNERITLFRIAVASALALLVGLALASAPIRIDASAVNFADGPDSTAFSIGWCNPADCLELTFGVGDYGVVIIPMDDEDAYPEGPTGRINTTVALQRSEMIERVGGGILLVHDTTSLPDLVRDYTAALTDLGFVVHADSQARRVLYATHNHVSYRLVFGYETVDDKLLVRVYIGS